MNLYEQQISARNALDDALLSSSLDEAANAVLGRRFSFAGDYPETAVGQIFRWFRLPPVPLPTRLESSEEKATYAFHAAGIMSRSVALADNWYRFAVGPMLAKRADTGEITALLPRGLSGYSWFDPQTKRCRPVNRKNASMFQKDALSFYKPLPNRPLKTKDLLRFCLGTWSAADVVFALALLTVSTLLGLFTPKISYYLFSVAPNGPALSLLLSTLFFGICTVVSSVLFRGMSYMMTAKIGLKTTLAAQAATFMRVLLLPNGFFHQFAAGDLAQRISFVEICCTQMTKFVVEMGLTAAFSLAYFSQVLVYTPQLALPTLAVVALSIIASWVFAKAKLKITKIGMELSTHNSGIAFDTITGIQKIKLAGAEKRMFARFAGDFAKATRPTANPPLTVKLAQPITLLITLAGQFIMYAVALKSSIDVASYYAFQTAYAAITTGLTTLSLVFLNAGLLYAYLDTAAPILDAVPENNEQLLPVDKLKGGVELSHLSFRYESDSPDIFSDLSLKIRPGEYVAIVGRSGCGKSTLVKLLLGFEKPTKGAVYYDGVDLALLDKTGLRRKIGTVMQDDTLFTGSIYENITVCAPGLPVEDVWQAAECAGIADNLRELPMGLHTLVTEGSGGFSGGQKQRLMIARAIAPKPKLLIFDEATSALDNKTQKNVSNSLDALKCTRIVIAHRLSTIKHCDRILVIDKGAVAEEGTYEALIAKNGLFAQLVARQQIEPQQEKPL